MSFFVSEEIKDLITEDNLIEKKYSILLLNKKYHIHSVKHIKFYKKHAKAVLACRNRDIDAIDLLTQHQNISLIKNDTTMNLKVNLLKFSKKKEDYLLTLKIIFNN